MHWGPGPGPGPMSLTVCTVWPVKLLPPTADVTPKLGLIELLLLLLGLLLVKWVVDVVAVVAAAAAAALANVHVSITGVCGESNGLMPTNDDSSQHFLQYKCHH